jgi:hypothetical protein
MAMNVDTRLTVLALAGIAAIVWLVDPLHFGATRSPGPAPTGSAAASSAAGLQSIPAPSGEPRMTPPAELVESLRNAADRGAVGALSGLVPYATTPAVLEALDAVESRTTEADAHRLITCLRGRVIGSDMDPVFAALPQDLRGDDWRATGTSCLVDVVAARAEEDPDRSAQALAESVLATMNSGALQALERLDPAQPPAVIVAALDAPPAPDDYPSRFAFREATERLAIAAVAVGAAEHWPERVQEWLASPSLGVRERTLRALSRRTDAASMRLAALELAGNQQDASTTRLAFSELRWAGPFYEALADIAADTTEPVFLRAEAARLVGAQGGVEACQRLARVETRDETLGRALSVARASAVERWGARIR